MGACLRSKEIRWMDPKSIKFSEDSIAYFFQRGAPNTRWFTDSCVGFRRGDESLQSLLEKLSSGAIKVHDIPRIRVFKYKDCWYSPDNRRLWVFRQHGEDIQVDIVGRPANAYLAKLEQRQGDGESTFIIKDHERKQSHEFASKQDLLNQILKWSPRVLLSNLPFQEACVWPQIFKDELVTKFFEMEEIPLQYPKVESYMKILSQWLLEETRAQIQSSVLKISDLACTEILIDADIRPISKKSVLKRITFTPDPESFESLKRSNNLTTKVYLPAASDIVLMATFVPQNARDLYQVNECCTLAVVQGRHTSSLGSQRSYEAILHVPTHGEVYKALMEGERKWYAVKLESIVTCQRIWDALHQPEAAPMAEYIATYSQTQNVELGLQDSETAVEESKLQMYCHDLRRLNESQMQAVKSFIVRLVNKESGCCLGLIQGPPGTGKTSTLTAMLSATACLNTRILVCAPTNIAVNEAAQRFLVQRQEDLDLSQNFHFCSDIADPGAIREDGASCTPLRLGDIVMLGSEDRLTVEGSVLKHIFLPLRVKRLLAALHPEDGWYVLSRTLLMYLMEVSSPTSNSPAGQKRERSIIRRLGKDVIVHGETLCNDLPSSNLSSKRLEEILAAVSATRKLLQVIAHEKSDHDCPQFSSTPLGRHDIQGVKNQETSTRVVDTAGLHSQLPGSEVETGKSQEQQNQVDDAPQFSPQGCGKDKLEDGKSKDSQPVDDVIIIDDDDDAPQFSPRPYEETEAEVESTNPGLFYSPDVIRERQVLIEILTGQDEAPIFPNAAATSPDWLEAHCVENASVVFSTVSSVGLKIMKLGIPFSCVIVDEAAQLVEAETAIITQMKEVKHMVLVGDQKQLPATVMSQLAQRNGYGRSLFERLQLLGHPWVLLDVQYRMHPAISSFPNKAFYNQKLRNGENVLEKAYSRAPFQQGVYGPYAFIDVSYLSEENAGSSKRNPLEGELVVHLIERVHDSVCAAFEDFGSEDKPISIGVISPYGGQVAFIKDQMSKMSCAYTSKSGVQVLDWEVKSIDGFQGKESDIIIFSAVRANEHGRIGFVDDERRLNVALTRGRYAVWVLGSSTTLCAHSNLWRDLIHHAKESKSFFEAAQDEGMHKIVDTFRRHRKPVFHKNDDINWHREYKRIRCSESPRWSSWDCTEAASGAGPDWSSIIDPHENPVGDVRAIPADLLKEGEEVLGKQHSRCSGWDVRPSKAFRTSGYGRDGQMGDLRQRYNQRDRYEHSNGRQIRLAHAGQHGWGPSQQHEMNRFSATSGGPISMNTDVHEFFDGQSSCGEPVPEPHNWDQQPNCSWQVEGSPHWGDVG